MTEAVVTELHAGALRLALRPDLGGCIAGLWWDTLPVLRSTEPMELQKSRLSGSYPLIPYSNRLGFRRFRWRGVDYHTQPNFDDNPHSVHGMGWQRPWSVVAQSTSQAELVLQHPGDADWPFPLEARQVFTLSEDSLHCSIEVANRSAHAAPVGLGWHPYFPKRSRSRLHIELSGRWDNDATGLPTRLMHQGSIDGDIAHMAFDNCFEGWPGQARLRDEKLSVRLSSSLPYLVVFTPQERDYYCVEPVSHVSNALHMAEPAHHGLRTLEPGERFQAWMKLEIAKV